MILTPEQTKHIRPVNPTTVSNLLNDNHDDAVHYIKRFLETSKTDEFKEIYWFSTPRNAGHEKENTPILNELRELEKLEQLNPQDDINSRSQFLSKNDWTDSTLEPKAKQAVEALLLSLLNFTTFLHGIALTLESILSSKYNSRH